MTMLKVDRCKCLEDYRVHDSDVVYLKGQQYISVYHPRGIHSAYYQVYLNDRVSCNVNIKEFNNNFKKIKHESTRISIRSLEPTV
jgi:hypothetical protein